MKRATFLAFIIVVLSLPISAYQYPLSDSGVREAYFRGARKDAHTQKFLARYTHYLPMPKSGPHVATITIETPYCQVVEYSMTAFNFSAVDAEQKFLDAPAWIRVRVEIDLTATYTPLISSDPTGIHLRPVDFWQDFKINLIQRGNTIPIQHLAGEPLYASVEDGGSTLTGATVTVDFPAAMVASDVTTVAVLGPDGQEVRSDFDLSRLP